MLLGCSEQFLFLHKSHPQLVFKDACMWKHCEDQQQKKDFDFHFVSKREPQKQFQQFVKTQQLHAVWHDAVFKDFAGF